MKTDLGPPDDLNFSAEAGYKPVTILVPDVSNPDFVAAYKEQRAVIAKAAKACNEAEWWETTQTDAGWV